LERRIPASVRFTKHIINDGAAILDDSAMNHSTTLIQGRSRSKKTTTHFQNRKSEFEIENAKP